MKTILHREYGNGEVVDHSQYPENIQLFLEELTDLKEIVEQELAIMEEESESIEDSVEVRSM